MFLESESEESEEESEEYGMLSDAEAAPSKCPIINYSIPCPKILHYLDGLRLVFGWSYTTLVPDGGPVYDIVTAYLQCRFNVLWEYGIDMSDCLYWGKTTY